MNGGFFVGLRHGRDICCAGCCVRPRVMLRVHAPQTLHSVRRGKGNPRNGITVERLKRDPLWDPLREHSGFQNLLDHAV